MGVLILCGIYLIELVCYYFGLRILFDVKQKSWVWMAAGVFVTVGIGFLPVDAAGKNVLVTVSVIIVMFLSVGGKILEKGIILILVFLLVQCINGIYVYPCENILLFSGNGYTGNTYYLVAKCCTVLSLYLLNFVKGKIIQDKKAHINSGIYVIVGMIAALMMLCLGILNQVIIYLPDSKYIVLCNALNVAICVSIFLLVIFVIYIKKTHEQMEQLLKTERILKESQVNYYKQILKKETDTRKYRHDMVNHLVYIRDILDKNKIKDAQKYLGSVIGGFKKIQNTYYITGNEMFDTIMNYFVGMLSEKVIINIIGRSSVKIDMEDIDICTILSNLFQNAVEELTGCDNIDNAWITIEIQKGRQYVQYSIKNALFHEINEKIIDKTGFPKSHKSEGRNHGIGMMNVKSAVEKGGGNFKWYQEEGCFCAEVILPIKHI